MAFLIGFASFACGSLFGVLVDRGLLWRRPRFSPDTADLARRALSTAKHVFGQSTALGGRLHHPWNYAGSEVEQHVLDASLAAVQSRIVHRKFQGEVAAVRDQIKGVWASSASSRPRIFVPGQPLSPRELEWEKDDGRRAEVQRRHAEDGIREAEAALERLSKLERHT